MLEMLSTMFSYHFMQRALIVGVLVSLCAALLGVVLVLKHYSLIGHGLGEVGFAALALAVALDLPPMTVAIPLFILAGALMSDLLPDIVSASLGIAIYAMFIGILVPSLTGNWRMLALVAMTAVCNTLLSGCIAPGWALIISTLLCAWLGTYFVPLPGKEAANA